MKKVLLTTLFLLITGSHLWAEDARTEIHFSQPSFVLSNKQVGLAVTRLGGHMAPVTFSLDSPQPIRPYYISPWQDEPQKPMPAPVLVPLRGDFFCMPFGGNATPVAGETHPPHGEVAGSEWILAGRQKNGPVISLTMEMRTKVRPGKVTKKLSLVDGHNAVYLQHIIDGFTGKVPLGHHATLAMSKQEGAVRIAVSPFRFGMTYPGVFSDPAQREYQSLLAGEKWSDLRRVPLAWKGAPDADLTRLPARMGYADLVQIINEPWEKTNGPAWTTATNTESGYLWYSLKDAEILTSTVFWIENHGRHGHPWNGRNTCLGLEDVTAYFADGLANSSTENLLSRQGVRTAVNLVANKPTVVNYIQGAVAIPSGFDVVKTVEFGPGSATFVSESGKQVKVPVSHEFLKTGQL